MTLSLVHFRAYLISLRDGPLDDFQMSNGGFKSCLPEFHPITSSRYYSLSNVLLRGENDSKQSDEFQAKIPDTHIQILLSDHDTFPLTI